MFDQSFSGAQIRRCVTVDDVIRFRLSLKDGDIDDAVNAAEASANSSTYSPKMFLRKSIGGKITFFESCVEDHLIVSRLNQILVKSFRVSFKDRELISGQIRALLSENVPMTVVKSDISNFYETIDRRRALEIVEKNRIVSARAKHVLAQILGRPELSVIQGLPRGLSISATLSELYMREFDKRVSSTKGVYYFARYVDDMVAFAVPSGSSYVDEVRRVLPDGLSLNPEKTTEIFVDHSPTCLFVSSRCTCDPKSSAMSKLEFLGYKYEFPLSLDRDSKKFRSIGIGIADKKIKKIKTRLIRALHAFTVDGNFELLRQRLKYLSGVRPLYGLRSKSCLKVGNSYLYKEINDLGISDLKGVDTFFARAIHARGGSLGRELHGKLTPLNRKDLLKYSFVGAYQKRIGHEFSTARLGQIKGCWK